MYIIIYYAFVFVLKNRKNNYAPFQSSLYHDEIQQRFTRAIRIVELIGNGKRTRSIG